MATHHGDSGQPLDRDTNMTRGELPVVDTNVEVQQEFHPEDTAQFEVLENNNPTRPTAVTRELDDLCQRIKAEEEQPTESLHCIEQELQWLSISLNSPTHTEPLGKVLKHYMNTLCSQSHCYRIYLIFTGHDTTLLEDWVVDIETAADLKMERRTKLPHAKSKGLRYT